MGDSKIENAGVEAIEAKCKALYGEQKGYHFGVKVPYILGGPDPLDQVSIYKSNSGGIPHWHYISYGLTELYQKDSDYEEESGYGFELSFRLEDKGEQTPPVWPVSLMQNLARYVFKSGNVFKANEHMDANGPICLGTETKLTAFGFDIDPELGDMDTPYGHVEFIQIIPYTKEELEYTMLWFGEKFIKAYRKYNPMAVAVMDRDTYLSIPEFKAEVEAGIEQDGSSTGMFYIDVANMEIRELEGHKYLYFMIGAKNLKKLTNLLNARLPKGRDFYLKTPSMGIAFQPAEHSACGKEEEDFGLIKFSPESLEEFVAIPPHKGVYRLKSMPAVVEIVPTLIKDSEGKVVETIE